MIFNFKTVEDDAQYVIDPEAQTWALASSIIATPSVAAAASNVARFVPIEEGRLVPMGGGRYRLHPRKPLNAQGKPQLSQIVLLTVLTEQEGGVCVTFLQANVDIKDAQHQEIKKYVCECRPAVPAPTRPTSQPMPPITVEEQKAQQITEPEIV